jgi:hypothetical protein
MRQGRLDLIAPERDQRIDIADTSGDDLDKHLPRAGYRYLDLADRIVGNRVEAAGFNEFHGVLRRI